MDAVQDLPSWAQTIFNVVIAVGFALIVIYGAARKINSDKKVDDVDEKTQALIDAVTSQLDSERGTNNHLREVIERVAGERNEAIKEVGELRGQVSVLDSHVKLLTSEIKKLEEENISLRMEVSESRKEIAGLKSEFSNLLAAINANNARS